MNQAVRAALTFARLEVNSHQEEQLEALGTWLEDEAIPAGALGPAEATRIPNRHIAEGIVWSVGWPRPPSRCWDLGTGAGVPGLILAIVWPTCRLTLVDRSRRKVDLVNRAARIVGVEVAAEMADIRDLSGPLDAIVSRAAMPADRLLPHLRRLLSPGGVAVVSGSGANVSGYEEIAIPAEILDHSARLLMMRG